MIARIWKGAVRKQDGDAYARYMQGTEISSKSVDESLA